MGVIAGPRLISLETTREIREELEASDGRNRWESVRAELLDYGQAVLVKIEVPRDSDDHVIEEALVAIERSVLKRIPEKIPIFDNRESWGGVVAFAGSPGGTIVDGTGGGCGTPGRLLPRPRHGSPEDVEARNMVWWLNPESKDGSRLPPIS